MTTTGTRAGGIIGLRDEVRALARELASAEDAERAAKAALAAARERTAGVKARSAEMKRTIAELMLALEERPQGPLFEGQHVEPHADGAEAPSGPPAAGQTLTPEDERAEAVAGVLAQPSEGPARAALGGRPIPLPEVSEADIAPPPAAPRDGWAFIPRAAKAHYFVAGTSVCATGWFLAGGDVGERPIRSSCCVECLRKAEAAQGVAAAAAPATHLVRCDHCGETKPCAYDVPLQLCGDCGAAGCDAGESLTCRRCKNRRAEGEASRVAAAPPGDWLAEAKARHSGMLLLCRAPDGKSYSFPDPEHEAAARAHYLISPWEDSRLEQNLKILLKAKHRVAIVEQDAAGPASIHEPKKEKKPKVPKAPAEKAPHVVGFFDGPKAGAGDTPPPKPKRRECRVCASCHPDSWEEDTLCGACKGYERFDSVIFPGQPPFGLTGLPNGDAVGRTPGDFGDWGEPAGGTRTPPREDVERAVSDALGREVHLDEVFDLDGGDLLFTFLAGPRPPERESVIDRREREVTEGLPLSVPPADDRWCQPIPPRPSVREEYQEWVDRVSKPAFALHEADPWRHEVKAGKASAAYWLLPVGGVGDVMRFELKRGGADAGSRSSPWEAYATAAGAKEAFFRAALAFFAGDGKDDRAMREKLLKAGGELKAVRDGKPKKPDALTPPPEFVNTDTAREGAAPAEAPPYAYLVEGRGGRRGPGPWVEAVTGCASADEALTRAAGVEGRVVGTLSRPAYIDWLERKNGGAA